MNEPAQIAMRPEAEAGILDDADLERIAALADHLVADGIERVLVSARMLEAIAVELRHYRRRR